MIINIYTEITELCKTSKIKNIKPAPTDNATIIIILKEYVASGLPYRIISVLTTNCMLENV